MSRPHRLHLRTVCLLVVTLLGIAACGGGTSDVAGPSEEVTSGSATPDAATPAASAVAETEVDASTAQFPLTYTNCGTEYTVEQPPERVLVGWANSLATLQALGVEDTAIGHVAGSLSILPDGTEVPELSPEWSPNREVVVAAEPDLFVANDEGQTAPESGGVTDADLAELGANVFVLSGYCLEQERPDSIDVVYDDVESLARIFGVPDRAAAVNAELESRVASAAEAAGDYRTAFVQVFDGALYALSGSNYNAVLEAAGLTNELADIGESFAQITPEEVATLDPEAVVVAYDDVAGDAESAIAEVSELLAGSAAVEEGRVIAVGNSEISASGVTLVDVVEQLATGLPGE